jgi:catechol 2,3-dioxygenase-like lactoylglutathione lyase family enzyme
VSDLDRSIAFYEELTPLVVVRKNEDSLGRGAWLSHKGQVDPPFVLVLAEFGPEMAARFHIEPDTKIPILQPFAHLGIEVPTREDVDAVAAKARKMNGLAWEPMDMGDYIGYTCAVNDPDGNTIEFAHNQKVFSTIQELWA